jgi:hypothetical protein
VPNERCWATPSDTQNVTRGQGVAGSNPAVRMQFTSPLITVNAEVSGHIRVCDGPGIRVQIALGGVTSEPCPAIVRPP